jgi:hypothetical protein
MTSLSIFLRRVVSISAVFASALSVQFAHAQNNTPNDAAPDNAGVLPAAPAPGAGVQILEVGENEVASLRNLNAAGRANAVSLHASLATLQADEAAMRSLQSWVQNGGVVFLHTDAAQLFGYQTVTAREGENRLAGQLFGRAVAALPFGANPLLWSSSSGASLDGQAMPQLGIQTVYYQMQAGDQLVASHPAGTPLLRVTDLAVASGPVLYAAAIAPYGSGWAVFTPRLIEQPRADGAAFVRNIVLLANGGGSSVFAPPGQGMAPVANRQFFVGLPSSLIENASQDQDGNYGAMLAAWDKATRRDAASAMMQPNAPLAPETEPHLIVMAQEANAMRAALEVAARGGNATRLQALLAVLRARLELQRNDLNAARTWLETAGTLAPNAAEVLLWQGVWSAAAAENVLLASPVRGKFLSDAVSDWSRAQNAAPLLPTGSTPGGNAAPMDDAADDAQESSTATISGVPAKTLQNWIAAATRAGQLALVEPPLVTPIGGGNRVVLLRHFPEDPTLRTALPTGALLAQADEFLGANLDVEEILIFPNDRYYLEYSQAAHIGSSQVTFSPLAKRGNVVGNRILMVSQITVPVLLSPGPPPIYAPLGQAVPAVIARLHAQVLLHAIAQDGAPVPAWMQLGLMSLSNIAVTSRLGNNAVSEALDRTLQVGGLLGPEQFENVNLGADKDGIIEEQARRLMLFFYARFGAGAVIETLQRIGAGQNADDALLATTELTQTEFFIAWRDAEFGNRPRR